MPIKCKKDCANPGEPGTGINEHFDATPDKVVDSLGTFIRNRRTELEMTATELAESIGVSPSYILHIEGATTKSILSEYIIWKMSKKLEVDFDELMYIARRIPSDVVAKMNPYMYKKIRNLKSAEALSTTDLGGL